MSALTIGKLAQQAGVGVETVRFYEREGLLPVPPRRGFGFRHYPAESVERLHFIQRAKRLGFALKEVRELLELCVSADVSCAEVQQLASAKLADIEERIRELQRMRKALRALAEHCQADGPIGDCPILDFLSREAG